MEPSPATMPRIGVCVHPIAGRWRCTVYANGPRVAQQDVFHPCRLFYVLLPYRNTALDLDHLTVQQRCDPERKTRLYFNRTPQASLRFL